MKHSKRIFYALLVIALGFLFAFRYSTTATQNIPKNQDIEFVAVLKSEPKISYGQQVLKFGDARVYAVLFPRYRVGDKLKVGGFADEKGRIFRGEIEKVGEKKSFGSFFSAMRSRVSGNIDKLLPRREAALVKGTVLGVDDLGEEFSEQLIKTGTIHVVVVSGQNLMIVAGLFLSLVRYVGRRISLILALLAVFFYAFLTGFEPPVVRASLVVLASVLAIYFGREISALWSLILAAVVILIFWPTAVGEISFQLTFAASFGIIVLGRRLAESWGRLPLVGENTAIALSAYIFTAPIIIFYFGRISPLAPLANILVAEAVAPIMILGFLVSFTSLLWAGLAQIIAYISYVPALYFVTVVELFANLPVSQINFGQDNLYILMILYALLAVSLIILILKFKKNET